MHSKERTGYAFLFLLSTAGSTVAQLDVRTAQVETYVPAPGVEVNARETNEDSSRKWCTVYRENVLVNDQAMWSYNVKNDISMAGCEAACSDVSGDDHPGRAVTCGLEGNVEYQWTNVNNTSGAPSAGALQSAVAPCQCNDDMMAEIVHGFATIVLPAVAKVDCPVWESAFTSFLEIFPDTVINGIEDILKMVEKLGDVTDGHQAIIQSALQASHTFEKLEDGRTFFSKSLAKASCSQVLSDGQADQIFDGINRACEITLDAVPLPSNLGEWAGAFRMDTAASGRIYDVGQDVNGLVPDLQSISANKREESSDLEKRTKKGGGGSGGGGSGSGGKHTNNVATVAHTSAKVATPPPTSIHVETTSKSTIAIPAATTSKTTSPVAAVTSVTSSSLSETGKTSISSSAGTIKTTTSSFLASTKTSSSPADTSNTIATTSPGSTHPAQTTSSNTSQTHGQTKSSSTSQTQEQTTNSTTTLHRTSSEGSSEHTSSSTHPPNTTTSLHQTTNEGSPEHTSSSTSRHTTTDGGSPEHTSSSTHTAHTTTSHDTTIDDGSPEHTSSSTSRHTTTDEGSLEHTSSSTHTAHTTTSDHTTTSEASPTITPGPTTSRDLNSDPSESTSNSGGLFAGLQSAFDSVTENGLTGGVGFATNVKSAARTDAEEATAAADSEATKVTSAAKSDETETEAADATSADEMSATSAAFSTRTTDSTDEDASETDEPSPSTTLHARMATIKAVMASSPTPTTLATSYIPLSGAMV